jgi:LuxR family maltose regulon positive regulatory protein
LGGAVVGAKVRSRGKQPSIAKITRPGSSHIFARKRLFGLLDSARKFPVIFLTSPPGAGKTSLISKYLEEEKLAHAWYRIDEGDADFATFFHYMGLAAKHLKASHHTTLPAFSNEYIQSISVFSRRYFERFFSKIKPPFIIVLDNYHLVPADSEFHEMMSHGLADIPDGISIIILSRSSPPAPLMNFLINEKMHLFGSKELNFNEEEIRELARMKQVEKLTDETVRFIHEKTDGWAAGVVLMLETLKRDDIDYHVLERLSSDDIFDYFAFEIFQKVDNDTRQFLMQTSVLSVMTSKMAERLTGVRGSAKKLNLLSRDHYFTEEYPQEVPIYRYHPLFRKFLMKRAEESFREKEFLRIKRNAAHLLKEFGKPEDAFRLYQEAGAVKEMINVLRSSAQSLLEQGRYYTLSGWLESVPKELLADDPWILYWAGSCSLPFNPAESLAQFESAFELFRKGNDGEGLFLACSGIIEAIMYGFEGLGGLDRWFEVCNRLVEEFRGFPSEEIEANVACSMVRALALRRPEKFDMEKWVERLQSITQIRKDTPAKIKALTNLASYFYSEGNFQEMGITLNSLKEFVRRYDIPPLSRLNADWLSAAYCNVTSLCDECQKIVSESLHLAGSVRINLMEFMLMGHGVLSGLKMDDFDRARSYLHKMSSALRFLKPWEAGFYHYCAAWEALCLSNLSQASIHAEHCMKLCELQGNPWTFTTACLLKAYVSFEAGDIRNASAYIRQAESLGIRSRNQFTSFLCMLSSAYFLLRQEREKVALELLRKGLKAGKEKGFVNLYMSKKGVLETILTKALEQKIEEDYVKELIRRNDIQPDSASVETENWPWPLKIFTLRRFSILKDEKPFQYSRKVQQKPLSLLKALIAYGGRAVPEESLADHLWPESAGDAAHSSFNTTLSRLRQLLGYEQAIKLHEGKVYLDPLYCWVDVWAFERILGRVEAVWNEELGRKEREQAIAMTEKALTIYNGPFLYGENEPWMVSMRERLRNKFLRNVRRLGIYLERAGKLETAIEFYRKGIEVDDLAEEFYQRLMKCYLLMGKKAEALSVYKQCAQIFSSVIGIEPSRETETLRAEALRR